MPRCKGCIHDSVCNRDVGYGYSVCPHYKTADVVEVVRCKDCVHCTVGYCCRDIKGRSQMHFMGEDAFCSYGERKEQT